MDIKLLKILSLVLMAFVLVNNGFSQYLVHGTVSLAGKTWEPGGTVQFQISGLEGPEPFPAQWDAQSGHFCADLPVSDTVWLIVDYPGCKEAFGFIEFFRGPETIFHVILEPDESDNLSRFVNERGAEQLETVSVFMACQLLGEGGKFEEAQCVAEEYLTSFTDPFEQIYAKAELKNLYPTVRLGLMPEDMALFDHQPQLMVNSRSLLYAYAWRYRDDPQCYAQFLEPFTQWVSQSRAAEFLVNIARNYARLDFYSEAYLLAQWISCKYPETQSGVSQGQDLTAYGLIGQQAPPFRLFSVDGEMFGNENFIGQWTYFYVYNHWCPSCLRALDSFKRQLPALDALNVRLVIACLDLEIDPLQKYCEKQAFSWTTLSAQNSGLAEDYGVEVAQGYLIDPDGVVRSLNPRIVNLGKWVSVPAQKQQQKDTE
ncbi:MAG: redoxin domain-containing protein [Acidobacteria bacterium]|nr:redoxin domain-containing protein [Acidobacteriota bacterium]MCB9398666.1 redoxin domain-containing protein [Acidobacteriota bacterium]